MSLIMLSLLLRGLGVGDGGGGRVEGGGRMRKRGGCGWLSTWTTDGGIVFLSFP